jgi:hypothetical protein
MKLLVYDLKPEGAHGLSVNALAEGGVEVYSPERLEEGRRLCDEAPDPGLYDACVIHVGDDLSDNDPDPYSYCERVLKAQRRLFCYSGNPSNASDAIERLQKGFPEQRDLIWAVPCGKLLQEALIETAKGSGWLALERAAERRPIQYLAALAILCQGYLAVHASPDTNCSTDWGPQEISEALEKMGWTLMMESGDVARWRELNIGQHREVVTKPEWWRQVLREDSADELSDKVVKECSNLSKYHHLRKLLDAIYDEAKIAPGVVAKAYMFIYDTIGVL